MRIIFGDSHSRLSYNVADGRLTSIPDSDWSVFPVGGSTAHGLLNDLSQTGARKMFLDALDGLGARGLTVVLLFGEVDCVDISGDDPGVVVVEGVRRLHLFRDELASRPDVDHVFVCTTIPHSPCFCITRGPAETKEVLIRWNSLLQDPIDIYSPLTGSDGYLSPVMSVNPNDHGERHLNRLGSDRVLESIDRHVRGY